MFNRNPFGGNANQPPPPNYQNQPPPQYPPRRMEDSRRPPPHQQGDQRQHQAPSRGRAFQMRLGQVPKEYQSMYTLENRVAVSAQDFPPNQDGSDQYVIINKKHVLSARPLKGWEPSTIGMSEPQRTWGEISQSDTVLVEPYDPFWRGGSVYLAGTDIEVGFAGRRTKPEPYDQDELAQHIIKVFNSQMLAPGQIFITDHKSFPLRCMVRTVSVSDMSLEKPNASAQTSSHPEDRGILIPQTQINFSKDPRSEINLKASSRRPAANAVVRPDFKFEDMGIGGLDSEFSTIFRRAFASRIFPPGLVQKLGIPHVKGMLLFGPPGTGKTLIARQIGNMLNAAPPKVINGPEVLNKYVGQSEENVRKMFADAEKEYKEKGDESQLHIIIFDELDAVCKQRGSGAAGGTGVGDSVVNQLLSKLDGVDQLNNILLIGMTNRKDMIDDALLRPGRLEVHVEISLPDEKGRQQILNIHTQKMRVNNVMDSDVDISELAAMTKNYSGAEISGLVKAASSFAFERHIKVGTMAGIKDDVADMKVNRQDFMSALNEIQPAYGVSEEELADCIEHGIIPYSGTIEAIKASCAEYINEVRTRSRLVSVLFQGPPGSGKTALAAHIALSSDFPFVKMISAKDMIGFGELAKISYLQKAFTDAYKSTTSLLVLDNIEQIFDWIPIGPRFSQNVFSALRVLIQTKPPSGRRLLIFATTSERQILSDLQLLSSFQWRVEVPTVQTWRELATIINDNGDLFTDDDGQNALQGVDVRAVVGMVQQRVDANGGPSASKSGAEVGVGVKEVLKCIGSARQNPRRAERFAELMAQAVCGSQDGLGLDLE